MKKALLVLALPAVFGLMFGDPLSILLSGGWLLVLATAGLVELAKRMLDRWIGV